MLATRGDRLPAGAEWCHEVKWDGMRVLAEVTSGRARLWSRNENDVTVSFPELAGLDVPDGLLDGEVVALDAGRPSFGALAERMHQRNARRAAALAESRPVTLLVFDLLREGDRDLTGLPLEQRRARLERLDPATASCQVPAAYDDGEMLLEATRQQQLEGVVSKRLSSRYVPGARSPHWLKFPHRPRSSWVVGGWRPETGSTDRVGAVLVGEVTPAGLVFRGRVGSGIAGRTAPVLRALLAPLAAERSPFVDPVPRVDAVGTRWVRPELVVDVESLGFSHHDRLRQPSFRGVRTDLTPADLAGGE
ncbi:non-homologous end-joining DNA ligase [Nocardioides solisilvae]|uniref:non-homologous end-joining DNA ligase n=1 Tax=Nocardioides solisilvae TaxID=1542435 RepID=UPI001EF5316F|nr:non-homologous end-joining DNA ligase [Nocardioides solisilvae]